MRALICNAVALTALSTVRTSHAEEPLPPLQGSFVAFVVGDSAVIHSPDEPRTNGPTVSLLLGQRLTRRLQLVEEADTTFATRDSGPLRADTNDAVLVGVRWVPIGPGPVLPPALPWFPVPYVDLQSVYLRGAVGISFRERTIDDGDRGTSETTDTGFGTAAAVGWMALQGRGYALGLELRGQVSFFREGPEYLASLNVVIQLGR